MFQQDITTGPGTGTFASHTMEILIMLLGAGLLGLWLGWVLWSKYKKAFDQLRLENEGLRASTEAIQTELSTLKIRLGNIDKERDDLVTRLGISDRENIDLRTQLNSLQINVEELTTQNRQLETEIALTTGEAIEISDQADSTLNSEEMPYIADEIADITAGTPETGISHATSLDLELTSGATPEASNDAPPAEDHLESLTTNEYDLSFQLVMQDPEEAAVSRSMSAPVEHEYFSDQSFEALSRNMLAPTDSSPQDAQLVVAGFTPLQHDDLKIVEGIGPKIEELLFTAGITTYSELAAAPVTRLKEILAEAGSRFLMHDPGTWSAQALLAANGEWENLKAYQGFLDSGKAPKK